MAGFFDYLMGNMGNLLPQNNYDQLQNPINIPQPNLNIPLQQNPMLAMQNRMMPNQNPMLRNPVPPPPAAMAMMQQQQQAQAPVPNNVPPYARGLDTSTFPQANLNQQGGQGVAGARTPLSPQDEKLRQMMIMDAMMGGGEEPIQGPNGALPSGSGLQGSGGFQNNPDIGLLNSFPPQMPPRKRFIGGSY